MSSSSENESEILLGNKQLLAIFFVVAILLGIAFTGGYMVGRGSQPGGSQTGGSQAVGPQAAASQTNGSSEKAPVATGGVDTGGANHQGDSAIETHPVGPGVDATPDEQGTENRTQQSHAPLGTPKQSSGRSATTEAPRASSAAEEYAPQSGQTFLQVTALARDDAYAVAAVLTRKGFRAHSVPMASNGKLYRVLVGPIRDTSELSSTRDALRKTAGFQDVIVRRY
jgi:cell division septation protein DedD